MPLCGFNKKMLDGLQMFNEGLVEHGLMYRAEKNGETLDQAIKRELADMLRMLLELQEIDDSAKRTITEGIVKYAMGFYLIMRIHGPERIPQDYHALIKKILAYFQSMDEKYYGELEGRPDDMQQLVAYLNKKEI